MHKGVGVFSDIHGNRRAFAAIVQAVRERRDLDWYCLGDVVGWFFRPVECVLMLKALVDEGLVKGVVAGNHDLMALGAFTDNAQRIDRMLATAFSAGMLEQCHEARDFLRSFESRTFSGSTWIAAHHSPFDAAPQERSRTPQECEERIRGMGEKNTAPRKVTAPPRKGLGSTPRKPLSRASEGPWMVAHASPFGCSPSRR